jgi:hypothetical protein
VAGLALGLGGIANVMDDGTVQPFLDSIADRRDRPRKWRAMPLREDASCEEVRAFLARCLEHLQACKFDKQAAVDRIVHVLESSHESYFPAACISIIYLVEFLPEFDHANFDAVGFWLIHAKKKGYEVRVREVIGKLRDAWVREHFLEILDNN